MCMFGVFVKYVVVSVLGIVVLFVFLRVIGLTLETRRMTRVFEDEAVFLGFGCGTVWGGCVGKA